MIPSPPLGERVRVRGKNKNTAEGRFRVIPNPYLLTPNS